MSFVPTITSIHNINNNGIEPRSFQTPFEGVVLGETLEATVLEKLAGNKYTVALKNVNIPATSNSPLNIGEKLTVKVNSLHPQILLNVIGSNSSSGNAAVHENLLQWRANPEALVQVAGKFAGIARLLKYIDLSETFLEGDVKKLIKLFDDIILSRQTKANRLFLKDFTSRTGLLPESSLKQTVKDSSPKGISKAFDDNLKALLLKLTEAANDILRGDPKPGLELKLKLDNIMAFAGDALNAIEVSQ